MKKIFRYVILLIVICLVVKLYVSLLTKPHYKDMENYAILIKSPKIEITESKVSKNKGYIKGNATNDIGELIRNLKIKFDFFDEAGSFLGTEYREEEIFNASEKIQFEIKYEYNNVAEIRISIIK